MLPGPSAIRATAGVAIARPAFERYIWLTEPSAAVQNIMAQSESLGPHSLTVLRGLRRLMVAAATLIASLASFVAQVQAAPIPPECPAGHWDGMALSHGEQFELALDFDAARCAASVDFPEIPLYGVPFALARTSGAIEVSRHPAGAAPSQFKLKQFPNLLIGTFSGVGVTDARVRLRRTDVRGHFFREEAVSFENDGVRLAGTLILPRGDGPYPAAVIVHGSGAEDRNLASYRSRGVLLARHGIAALIYDKRGTGQSTADYTIAGLDDLARDALAGVAVLKARSDIVPDRIGIMGHSQGGWIAPLAATISSDVAFLIVTSPSGVGPMEQSVFDNSNQMRSAGWPDSVIEEAQNLRQRVYDGVRARRFDANLQAELDSAQKQPWFVTAQLPSSLSPVPDGERRMLLFSPLPVWQQVKIPVLAVWGSADSQVPVESSRNLIEGALRVGENHDFEAHVLNGLTHVLVRAKGSAFVRGTPEFESILSRWLTQKVLLHA